MPIYDITKVDTGVDINLDGITGEFGDITDTNPVCGTGSVNDITDKEKVMYIINDLLNDYK